MGRKIPKMGKMQFFVKIFALYVMLPYIRGPFQKIPAAGKGGEMPAKFTKLRLSYLNKSTNLSKAKDK